MLTFHASRWPSMHRCPTQWQACRYSGTTPPARSCRQRSIPPILCQLGCKNIRLLVVPLFLPVDLLLPSTFQIIRVSPTSPSSVNDVQGGASASQSENFPTGRSLAPFGRRPETSSSTVTIVRLPSLPSARALLALPTANVPSGSFPRAPGIARHPAPSSPSKRVLFTWRCRPVCPLFLSSFPTCSPSWIHSRVCGPAVRCGYECVSQSGPTRAAWKSCATPPGRPCTRCCSWTISTRNMQRVTKVPQQGRCLQ
mmetsp:Transcript_14036/g.44191  ORF Transcript_14036/g.44191 Transcript_14036/m.44191 type:complete len:254 (-) Transcript_14036:177-938(-)